MLVLFVDDDPEDYETFCEALRYSNAKAKCLHSFDGQEALSVLNSLIVNPDYIFLDVNMPKMGGKECLIKIKADPDLKDIPVIVYSTTSTQKEIQIFKELGAEEFVVKPTAFLKLVETLNKLLL